MSGTSEADLLNLPNNWMKSIALERHFLLTFCCCRQKVSRTASGRRAGCCVKKAMDGGKRQRIKKIKDYSLCQTPPTKNTSGITTTYQLKIATPKPPKTSIVLSNAFLM
jgi:hypothetical protein